MKTLLTLILHFGIIFMANAQDSWKVTHNGKVQLENTEELPEKNTFAVRIADLNKKGALTVAYKAEEGGKGWVRTFMFVDDADTELASFKGSSTTIQNAALRSLFKKASTIKIYTMALPSDPKKAALVRVRRVHLATVTLSK
jgi:hypothetical protein